MMGKTITIKYARNKKTGQKPGKCGFYDIVRVSPEGNMTR